MCGATSNFDTTTGTVDFNSSDMALYPYGAYTIEITGTSPESGSSLTEAFSVILVDPDPCVVGGGLDLLSVGMSP